MTSPVIKNIVVAALRALSGGKRLEYGELYLIEQGVERRYSLDALNMTSPQGLRVLAGRIETDLSIVDAKVLAALEAVADEARESRGHSHSIGLKMALETLAELKAARREAGA